MLLGMLAPEVRHSHVRYALMSIPRTKNQYNSQKRCVTKIMMEFRGGRFRDAESVTPVRSNIACLFDLQTAFMWLLRARWTAVIDLDLIDSFSMIENTPQPKWTHHVRSFWCPKILHEVMECRLADNQDHVLMYMRSLSVGPPLHWPSDTEATVGCRCITRFIDHE